MTLHRLRRRLAPGHQQGRGAALEAVPPCDTTSPAALACWPGSISRPTSTSTPRCAGSSARQAGRQSLHATGAAPGQLPVGAYDQHPTAAPVVAGIRLRPASRLGLRTRCAARIAATCCTYPRTGPGPTLEPPWNGTGCSRQNWASGDHLTLTTAAQAPTRGNPGTAWRDRLIHAALHPRTDHRHLNPALPPVPQIAELVNVDDYVPPARQVVRRAAVAEDRDARRASAALPRCRQRWPSTTCATEAGAGRIRLRRPSHRHCGRGGGSRAAAPGRDHR